MHSGLWIAFLILLIDNFAIAGIPQCIKRTRASPYYDPNTVKTSCDRALNELYREAIVTGFSQHMIFRKSSPFLSMKPTISNVSSDLTARSSPPDSLNSTPDVSTNLGCVRGVCPLPMQWEDPIESKTGKGCIFKLDISYDFPASTEDVLTLGHVWEVGKDLRLMCGDAYMASETIGPSEKIRLAKRFTSLHRPRMAEGSMNGHETGMI